MAFLDNVDPKKVYLGCSAALGLKVLMMAPLTGRARGKAKVVSNEEDKELTLLSDAKVGVDDNVERVRRAHLNDLENIPVFLLLGGAFLMTNPTGRDGKALIAYCSVFTLARYMHTVMYLNKKQPHRGMCFMVGLFSSVALACHLAYRAVTM